MNKDNPEDIELQRQAIVEQHGEWTAHNIYLKENRYTYGPGVENFLIQMRNHGAQLRRVVQVVSDITNQPLSDLRVLDLASLEGLYGLEFARHGASVVAIEGRQPNIEKARFAKNVLGLKNIEFVLDDVRNLSVEKYGRFDVVLCLGILYHLDAPDVFHFVEQLFEVCERAVVICTHVAKEASKSHWYNGKEYFGAPYSEPLLEDSRDKVVQAVWHSLDNVESFWFTRPSLLNLLTRVGFTSVYTCQTPAFPTTWKDPSAPRDAVTFPAEDTLVAVKGKAEQLFSMPLLNDVREIVWSESKLANSEPDATEK
jgi:2-polyprenyl-3-methyl-5-hydroxy-6-metoxy-1,4-benzoquinol methylase